jgi:4-amino-4-deoxy-L-arabinose transferase-like glycosyltransferase
MITTRSLKKYCFTLLIIILGIRLVTLAVVPLSDKTEARYGNISRIMVTSGDWVTLQIEPGVPFWGNHLFPHG